VGNEKGKKVYKRFGELKNTSYLCRVKKKKVL
jgi:hypothetical protein